MSIAPEGGLFRLARSNSDFAKLWGGVTISDLGSSVTNLALPLVAVITLQVGAKEMGFLNAATHLPVLLFALLAGVWIDRAKRKPILVASAFGQGLVIGLVPAAALVGWLSIELLYIVAFISGTLAMIYVLASTSFLPSIVKREDLVEGNARLQLSTSTTNVAGPGAAGYLVDILGAPLAILVDSISYFLSGLFLLRIRFDESDAIKTRMDQGVLAAIKEGISTLFSHPILRAMTIGTALASAAGAVQHTVWTLFLVRTLGITPIWLGIIGSVAGGASIIGALSAVPLAKRMGAGWLMIIALLLEGIAMAVLPFAGSFGWMKLPAVIAIQAVFSLALTLFSISQISLRQAVTPDRLLGRINATRRLVVFGIIPIAALSGGYLGETFGWEATLLISAAVMMVAFTYLILSSVRVSPEAVVTE
ncbi:MAG: MFS transporter [Gemmatimonadota bacterium]|nr:MFS transporter [Gemmatimonadota bacterium]